MTACRSCSRWLSDENPQIGSECQACVWEDLARQAAERDWDDGLLAYVPSGHPTFCQGCGYETAGDLCRDCDDSTVDHFRAVRKGGTK